MISYNDSDKLCHSWVMAMDLISYQHTFNSNGGYLKFSICIYNTLNMILNHYLGG